MIKRTNAGEDVKDEQNTDADEVYVFLLRIGTN